MQPLWFCGTLVIAPALGAPSTIEIAPPVHQGSADAECWAGVARSETVAGQRYVDEDVGGASKIVVSALDAALRCGAADAEQKLLVLRALKLVLVDFGAVIQPSEHEVRTIHTWYARLAGDPATSTELTALAANYQSFAATYPAPPAERPPQPDLRPKPDGPLDTGKTHLSNDDDTVRRTRARGFQISGASLLVLGVSSLAAGFVTLNRIDAQSRALAEMCTPACTNAADAAPLIKRGELYESLTPALLAVGGTLAITGGALLGVGTRWRKGTRTALTPVVAPRFAGASWTIQF